MEELWKAVVAYSQWNRPISSVPLSPVPPAKMPEKSFHLYYQPTEPPARTWLRRQFFPTGAEWARSLFSPPAHCSLTKAAAAWMWLNMFAWVSVDLRHATKCCDLSRRKKNQVLTRSDRAISREYLWHMFAQWQHMQSQWSAVYEVRGAMEMQHHPSVASAHWAWC